jgi:hypothetical protein
LISLGSQQHIPQTLAVMWPRQRREILHPFALLTRYCIISNTHYSPNQITMKRKILFLMAFATATILMDSCQQNDLSPTDPAVQALIESGTFKRIKPGLENYGTIDVSKIQHERIADGQTEISILKIPVFLNGKQMGTAIAVPLTSNEFLPFGDTYAVNFENYKNFDFNKMSGQVEMIDMNYEEFVHSKVEISNNKIKSWVGNELPIELKEKYSTLRKSGNIKSGSSSRTQYYTCDYNQNGDIGFYECYKCVAESMDAETSFFCDIPISGWLGCWSVSSSFCVILSATY